MGRKPGWLAVDVQCETLTEKPTIKNAFLKRRCIVPAEAFYECVGPKIKKQPLHISRRNGGFLSMAGLYNFLRPTGSEGRPISTFTVVNTEANQWMTHIHTRMPVMLRDDQIETWLDPTVSDPHQLVDLMKALTEDFLGCHPVAKSLLNSGLIDAPECADNIEVDYTPLLRNTV